MDRKKLIHEINEAGRAMSTVSVLFHQAVAEKVGLSGADHKYLNLLFEHGSMTAGEMAKKTNLTTGAVTGIIDRLEKQNLVTREHDPQDRRKVNIVLQKENAFRVLGPIFNSLEHDLSHLFDNFDDDQLITIKHYLNQVVTLFENKIEDLKNSN
jgi:DNA-binding MarR family transcriptional regulator